MRVSVVVVVFVVEGLPLGSVVRNPVPDQAEVGAD
jgi:hypothetical protein